MTKEEVLTIEEHIRSHATQFYLYILTFFSIYVFVQFVIYK